MTGRSPLSLYLHIPFCTLKCSYCDFNSYAGIESLMRPFVDALCDEMRLWAPVVADRRVETAFFGGGTPSLLPVKEVERIVGAMRGAFELGPEHLSLYALTIEEGTKLAHDIERGRVPGPDGDVQAAMYEWSCERLAHAGYHQYEISNWCRPGEECRHNLVYWRNGEWLGL